MAEMNVYGGPATDESVSQTTATNSVELGTKITWKGCDYVYCYNATGATLATEHLCALATGASGYSVVGTSTTDIATPCVGACVHEDVEDGYYFWAMTRGFATLETSNSIMTADYKAIGMAADGGIGVYEGVVTGLAIGFALNCDTASAGSAYCFISTGF